jgi:alpha/beta superfamily hydrolase
VLISYGIAHRATDLLVEIRTRIISVSNGVDCECLRGILRNAHLPLHCRFSFAMGDVFHRTFFINGPAGRLEALLWTVSSDAPRQVALVCHPHPLFGGTLHNKVVFRVAKALHAQGFPVLRFNFRGAGLSEGVHDAGRAERDDVVAALDHLATEFPDRPILLSGFSFGAWVGLRVGCEHRRVNELIGLGLPVNDSDLSYLESCAKPKLIIQGSNDQFGSREKLQALFDTVPEPKKLVFVEGADHFFTAKLDQVSEAIDKWLEHI